jgi:hypothetical protein
MSQSQSPIIISSDEESSPPRTTKKIPRYEKSFSLPGPTRILVLLEDEEDDDDIPIVDKCTDITMEFFQCLGKEKIDKNKFEEDMATASSSSSTTKPANTTPSGVETPITKTTNIYSVNPISPTPLRRQGAMSNFPTPLRRQGAIVFKPSDASEQPPPLNVPASQMASGSTCVNSK